MYKNLRILKLANGQYYLTETKYTKEGNFESISNVLPLGITKEEAKDNLEGLISDLCQHPDKEVLTNISLRDFKYVELERI